MIKNSYIYTGTVIHKRFKPKIHSFNYKVFSLLIDLSELDLMQVEIVSGASSAFYGPNAFNGVISMATKNPFEFPGLSASIKMGERNLQEYAVRWAQGFKRTDGTNSFGYKLNFFYLKGIIGHIQNKFSEIL